MNNQKGLSSIVIVLIIALAVGGAYYLGKNSSTYQPTPTSTTQSSPSPSDETANWKTYTNKELGFSIKYPSDLVYVYDYMKDAPARETGQLSIQNFDGSLSNSQVDLTKIIQFHLTVTKTTKSLEDYVIEQQKLMQSEHTNLKLKPIKSITVAGQAAFEADTVQKYEVVLSIWLKHKDFVYTMEISPSSPANNTLLRQIVSTFKFTN